MAMTRKKKVALINAFEGLGKALVKGMGATSAKKTGAPKPGVGGGQNENIAGCGSCTGRMKK